MQLMNRFLYSLKMEKDEGGASCIEENKGHNPEFDGYIIKSLEGSTVVPVKDREVSDGCLESVYNVSAPYPNVSEGVSDDMFNEQTRPSISGQIAWASARNGNRHRPYTRLSALLCGVVVVVCFHSTWNGYEAMNQLYLYMAAVGLIVAIDPLEFVSRMLSKQARLLMSASDTLVIVALIREERNVWTVAVLFCMMSVALIVLCNRSWIRTENWMMSREVEQALNKDPNNKASLSWRATGKRKARATLHELGYPIKEYDLDCLGRALYSLGYWSADWKATEQNAKIQRREDRYAELKSQYEELEGQKAELHEELTEQEERYAKLETYCHKLKEEKATLENNYDLLYAEYERLLPEEEEEEAAEDLTEEAEEMTVEERIQEYLEEGYSIRETADLVGCKRWLVEKVKKNTKIVAFSENVAINE